MIAVQVYKIARNIQAYRLTKSPGILRLTGLQILLSLYFTGKSVISEIVRSERTKNKII